MLFSTLTVIAYIILYLSLYFIFYFFIIIGSSYINWLALDCFAAMVLIRLIFVTAVAVTCAATDRRRTTAADERQVAVGKRQAPTDGDYADRSSDGSYAFRYADRNQFHSAAANKDNVVSGRYIMYLYYNIIIRSIRIDNTIRKKIRIKNIR